MGDPPTTMSDAAAKYSTPLLQILPLSYNTLQCHTVTCTKVTPFVTAIQLLGFMNEVQAV